MKYYSVLRPIAPGTYPNIKGNQVLDIVNFDKREYCSKIGREAWGYIEYEKPLPEYQYKAFELFPADFHEDKQKLCTLLCKTLRKTRDASDLVSLTYERLGTDDEIVTATFESGGFRKINVSMDSGVAMIRDIVNHLEV